MSENDPIGYANEFLAGWGPIYQTRDIAKAQAGLTSFKNVRRMAVPVYDHPTPSRPALDELVEAAQAVITEYYGPAACECDGDHTLYQMRKLESALAALKEGGSSDETR